MVRVTTLALVVVFVTGVVLPAVTLSYSISQVSKHRSRKLVASVKTQSPTRQVPDLQL